MAYRMISKSFIVKIVAVLIFIVLTSCQLPMKPNSSELDIETLSQDQLKGSLISGETGIFFDLAQHENAFEGIDNLTFRVDVERNLLISDQDGNNLIEVDAGGGLAVLSIMDGAYKISYSQPVVGMFQIPEVFSSQEKSDVEFVKEGNPEALERLVDSPSYRLIPFLSRALGELGINGKSASVSYFIHLISAEIHHDLVARQIIDSELPSGTVTLSASFAPENFVVHIDDSEPGVVFKDNGREGTRLFWKGLLISLGMSELEAEFTVSSCDGLLLEDPSPEAEQLYQDCVNPVPPKEECVESDPEDDCFGMCGPGCDCWESVCGDCCVHPGCQYHDWTCDAETEYVGCILPHSLTAAALLCGSP